jgi:hypothetical protein
MRLEGGVESEAFGCKGVMRDLPPEQETPRRTLETVQNLGVLQISLVAGTRRAG